MTRSPLALRAGQDRALGPGRPLVVDHETAPVSSLMIGNPFAAGAAKRWFSTHPDTAERIARLRAVRGLARA